MRYNENIILCSIRNIVKSVANGGLIPEDLKVA